MNVKNLIIGAGLSLALVGTAAAQTKGEITATLNQDLDTRVRVSAFHNNPHIFAGGIYDFEPFDEESAYGLVSLRAKLKKGFQIGVADSIGAGDSFLAGFLRGWLRDNLPPADILAASCRLSEFVAGCDGAMPSYERSSDGSIVPA